MGVAVVGCGGADGDDGQASAGTGGVAAGDTAAVAGTATQAASDTTVTVTRPTVIAFYHTDRMGGAAPSYVLEGASRAGTVSEFEFHLPRQQSSLAAMGWHLVVLYRADFQAVAEDGAVLGTPDSGVAGYMVVTPEGVLRTRYGLLSTEELEQFVRESR